MLALRMGRTVGELMNTMSSQEFSMWQALYAEDQWGERNDDYRTGLICSAIGNFAGKSLPERAQLLKPADFMPHLAPPVKPVVVDPIAHFTAVAASKKTSN